VLECIKAQSNGKKGSKISAAIMTTTIIDPKGRYLGGFACEYSGSGTRKESEISLSESIAGMIKRRGYGNIKGDIQMYKDNKTDSGFIIHPGKIFVYENLDVVQEHGSVFTAICFVSYRFPTISKSRRSRKSSKTRKHRK
jgi:pyruvoyl-dependent arginine decarboxylase (PvlArgDC)